MGHSCSRTARIYNRLGVKMELLIANEFGKVIQVSHIETGEYKDVAYSLLNNDNDPYVMKTISFAVDIKNVNRDKTRLNLGKDDIRDYKALIFTKTDQPKKTTNNNNNDADQEMEMETVIKIERFEGCVFRRLGFVWRLKDFLGEKLWKENFDGRDEENAASAGEETGEIPLMDARARSHDVADLV